MKLGNIEKKVFGALLMLSNDKMEVTSTHDNIAKHMGYKKSGGSISSALQLLELKNHIEILPNNKFKVFL